MGFLFTSWRLDFVVGRGAAQLTADTLLYTVVWLDILPY